MADLFRYPHYRKASEVYLQEISDTEIELPPAFSSRPPTVARRQSSLYSLKSFSSTQLSNLSALVFPSPPVRPSLKRSASSSSSPAPAEWISKGASISPDSESQPATMRLNLTPLLSDDIFTPPVEVRRMKERRRLDSIVDMGEEEEVGLAYALTLGPRPSYTPPYRMTGSYNRSSWNRSSITSVVSSSDDSEGPISPTSTRWSDADPAADVDTPLSPSIIPSQERRKGSVVFPSRKNSSCITLGQY